MVKNHTLLCLLSIFLLIKWCCSFPHNDVPFLVGKPEGVDGDAVKHRPLTDLDFERGKKLLDTNDEHLNDHVGGFDPRSDPIEIAGYFQGDIILSDSDYLALFNGGNLGIRNAIVSNKRLWPNAVIPYKLDADYNDEERAFIASAMDVVHTKTCIRFVPYQNETDHIVILRRRGCSSNIGRQGGVQYLTVGQGCLYPGIIMHELMHAIGFWHEHSRYDRNDYIDIIWANIQSNRHINFEKFDWYKIQTLGIEYDLGSILHYGPYSFSRDRIRPTIIPKKTEEIGQRQTFSMKDIQKMRVLYNCPYNASDPIPCMDTSSYCVKWKALGECQKNPKWMITNCARSCGTCGKKLPCKDKHHFCSEWGAAGECFQNPNYMYINCPKSCNRCNSTLNIDSSNNSIP